MRVTGPARSMVASLGGDESLELPEFEVPPADPLRLLAQWLAVAEDNGVREPRAMTLATCDSEGRPSVRVVSLKGVDAWGVLFTSHLNSRKGKDLEVNPEAAGDLYWRETLQQVTFSGPVERVSEDEADVMFKERPRAAQATTAVSRQSEPLDDEPGLRERARVLVDAAGPIARPAGWGGYRIRPDRIEFWQGRGSRLHRRLEYRWASGAWKPVRLQP